MSPPVTWYFGGSLARSNGRGPRHVKIVRILTSHPKRPVPSDMPAAPPEGARGQGPRRTLLTGWGRRLHEDRVRGAGVDVMVVDTR